MTFHIFHINEVYSNADGSVQFMEFVGDADGQHEWAGHAIQSTNNVSTNTYTITSDLSDAATSGKSVLLATQGFADLGIVTPDYIIPNGFLFTSNGTVNFPGLVGGGGTLTYAELPVDGVLSLNHDGSTGTNSPTNFSGSTGTVQGTTQGNVISGTDGNDNLTSTAGDDTLDGGAGVDTAIYSGNRADYTISATAVSGPDGNDILSSIERLQFTDKNIAIDLNDGQAANNTVRIIGAAFDAPTIQEHPDYVGIGLDLFDSGKSVLEVTQLVVDVLGLSNHDFVDTVYQNVVGAAPSAAEHDLYLGMLEGSGATSTQAQLLELAANTEVNAINIDLIGLQQSGVEFV